jgi:hypothetical protein
MATSALKWALYRTAYAMGRADALIAQRSTVPSQQDAHQFQQARARVAAVHQSLFGTTAHPTAQEIEVVA